MESPILMAFVLGIVSACSFPLGALTSAFWKPSDRALAVLLAFGGGALLAALTMDLVGAALDRGDFWFLAPGCILGSVLFIQLNHLVNARGGFLRKTSTTFNYIRSRERHKFKRVASHIGRIDIFQDLPPQELEELAAAVFSREYRKGTTLYHQNDPSSQLYIIETGAVEVLDPQKGMHPFHRPRQNDAFGRLGNPARDGSGHHNRYAPLDPPASGF